MRGDVVETVIVKLVSEVVDPFITKTPLLGVNPAMVVVDPPPPPPEPQEEDQTLLLPSVVRQLVLLGFGAN